MTEYPIFNSIVNRIEAELVRRGINIKRFKTWDESSINATGLEIVVDFPGVDQVIKSVVINFDWDKFREATMARQLEGMSRHPLLRNRSTPLSTLTPNMDVEMSWQFNESIPFKLSHDKLGSKRVKLASEWMESINKRASEVLPSDHSLSRWHVDIDGDFEGRFISQMTFITYFSITLEHIGSLNSLHQMVDKKLQVLLLTSERILQLARRTLPIAS